MFNSTQTFLSELKNNFLSNNKDSLRSYLKINQNKKGFLKQTPTFSKDNILQIIKPELSTVYLEDTIIKKQKDLLKAKIQETDVDCLLRFRMLSKKIVNNIDLSHRNSQEIHNNKIKDYLTISKEQDYYYRIPLFYTTLFPLSPFDSDSSSDRDFLLKLSQNTVIKDNNQDVFVNSTLLRDETISSFNFKQHLSISIPKLNFNSKPSKSSVSNSSLTTTQKALLVNQIFSHSEFNLIDSNSSFKTHQKYSNYYHSQVCKYFCSIQFGKQINKNVAFCKNKIEQTSQIYFKQQIIPQEEYQLMKICMHSKQKSKQRERQKQKQKEISKQKQKFNICIPSPINKLQETNDDQFKFKAKQILFPVKNINSKRINSKERFQMPRHKINYIYRMNDVDRFIRANSQTKANQCNNNRMQQKKPIQNLGMGGDLNQNITVENKNQKLNKYNFGINHKNSNWNFNNSDTDSKRRNMSFIDNTRVRDIMYRQKNQLIDKINQDYPKRSMKIPRPHFHKKSANFEQNEEQIHKSIGMKEQIKRKMVERANHYSNQPLAKNKINLNIPSEVPSQNPYQIQQQLSQNQLRQQSDHSSESSQDNYLHQPQPSEQHSSSDLIIRFPIRINNLIIYEQQAFLQYQLYKINISSFESILKRDKNKYNCINVRIWIFEKNLSLKQQQKMNEIDKITRRLGMQMFYGETSQTNREESAMSLEDILKLEGAAIFSKSTIFQVAWKLNDEQQKSR